MDPATPVAAIQSATTVAQRTLRARLADFIDPDLNLSVAAPAVLVIGTVADLDLTHGSASDTTNGSTSPKVSIDAELQYLVDDLTH